MNIPEDFYKLKKFVTLKFYVIFFDGNVFIITSARKLNSATVEHIPSQTVAQISNSLNKVIKLYGRGGFVIRMILMDTDFEKVAELLGNVEFGISAAREHVG